MAESTTNQPAPSLASILMIKQKMAAKNSSATKSPTQTQPVVGAHSDEKIQYRVDPTTNIVQQPVATKSSENTNDQQKISRKTKQIEVQLLDKKMEEIDRKQETKKNEALNTWNGFDSLNYGFHPEPGQHESTPVSSTEMRQRSPTAAANKPATPPRERTSVRQQSAKKSSTPPTEENRSRTPSLHPQKTTEKESTPPASPEQKDVDQKRTPSPLPRNEKPIEKTPSPLPRQKSLSKSPSPPLPPPRRSKTNSVPSIDPVKSPEPEIPSSVSSIPLIKSANTKPVQSYEPIPLPISNNSRFKLFPDIKQYEIRRPKNAVKSIQRSMDRYRFHVW